MSQTGWTDKRPMSPHLSVWRWHVTMLGSILHRATGVANYVGVFAIVIWLVATAMGPDQYRQFAGVAASPVGQLVLFGFTLSVTYHLLNGVRHLIWDTGSGLNPRLASATGLLTIVLAVIGAAAIWLLAGLIPGVSLGSA